MSTSAYKARPNEFVGASIGPWFVRSFAGRALQLARFVMLAESLFVSAAQASGSSLVCKLAAQRV